MQSNKFTTTLFMQLNSTSTSDSNADLLTYNYVRDTEIRMTEQYKNSINDLKDTIKAEAQRSQDNFGKLDGQIGKLEGKLDGQIGKLEGKLDGQIGKLEGQIGKLVEKLDGQIGKLVEKLDRQIGKLDGQIGKLEGKLDGQIKELLNNKFALVLIVLLVASMQPDIRSLISIIIKFVNV